MGHDIATLYIRSKMGREEGICLMQEGKQADPLGQFFVKPHLLR